MNPTIYAAMEIKNQIDQAFYTSQSYLIQLNSICVNPFTSTAHENKEALNSFYHKNYF